MACLVDADDFPAENLLNDGVMKKCTSSKTIQPIRSRNKMPNPSLGRKDPDVKQANRVAGISGSSCFHL